MARRLLVIFLLVYTCTACTHPSKQSPVKIVEPTWSRVDRMVPNEPRPKVIWKGPPLVHPRGVMLDPDTGYLYVTDPGEPVKNPTKEPARIVAFKIKDGIPTTPRIFFSRPGFMISAKWGFLANIAGRKQILVADQGKSPDEYTFSGEGAKVFSVPILPDGTAGPPHVLWKGKPFVCPTGIAVVAQIAYVTDPCAGPTRTRPEQPNVKFPSSAIFGLTID
jgi:hypothetical protein